MFVPVMEIIMRSRLVWALALGIAMIVRADAVGSDSTSPQGVFDRLGLTQSDAWLVLPDEAGIHDGLGKVKEEAETVHVETTSRRDLRFEIRTDKHNLETLVGDLVNADTQISRLIATRQRMNTDDTDYPRLIEMYNAALKHRDSISQQVVDTEKAEDNAETGLAKVPDSRADYVNQVMDIATKAEAVARTYAAVSQDPQLAQAIAAANATVSPPVKLGPSPTFSADLDFLRSEVKDVIDSPIPVMTNPDEDALYVQAVINGTVKVDMIWDSGADDVVLSANTAKELGIRFTDQDPTLEVGTAGSDTIKAHEAMLDSIRLGGFTMRNVRCIVLPNNPSGHVDDLLGDTFQTHFVSRMDQRSHELQLTPVDSSVLVGAIPH
jgi:clan AA aspartic protease (TIGR02281 family)